MNRDYSEIEDILEQHTEMMEYSKRSITFLSVLLAVLKRFWIVIISLAIVLIPLIYYLLNMVPIYKSSSVVMVAIKGVSFLDAVSVVGSSSKPAKTQRYYTSILDSREYRDDIIEQVLATYPEMSRDSLVKALTISYDENPREKGFITINAYSQNREFALFLAQAAVDNFKRRSINLERQDAENVSKFINDQLVLMNKKMEQAEDALQSFLRENKFIAADTEMGVGQELMDLEKQLSEAEAGLEMVEMKIESYDRQMKKLFARLSSSYQEGYIQENLELKNKLKEVRARLKNAESEGLTKEEIANLRKERDRLLNQIVRSTSLAIPRDELTSSYSGMTLYNLEKEIESALLEKEQYENQVNFYKIQIDRFKAEHPDISKDILKYASLLRARNVLQKTVDILLEKREEARIRVASEQGGVKVIDKPRLPKKPVPQNKTLKLIIGLFVALTLGVLICVVIDQFDDTIKDENDVLNIGVPVFGTIPVLTQSKKSSGMFGILKSDIVASQDSKLLTKHSEKSPVAEAYRSLKTSLAFIAKDKSKKIFVISSPSSAEGKSLTSINLAISFAQGGFKTLVLDCDLRRATQHRFFEFSRKPGLTNYLFDEVPLEAIIRRTPLPDLYLIPAGSSPPNPAEMVGSKKMSDFLDKIYDQYDIILIDSPPIMACVDSRVLAAKTDGMIIIAKVESTSYKAIVHAISLVKRVNVDILGIILNQTERKYGYGYYYAYRYYNPYSYYYSGYSYYYQEDEQTGERVRKKRKMEK